MAAVETNAGTTVGSETRKRDRRGAEHPMIVERIAPALFRVYSGETSRYTVDIQERRCTCGDFRHRAGTEISRCKHVSRVLQTLGILETPIDAEPIDPTLPKQRSRWSR